MGVGKEMKDQGVISWRRRQVISQGIEKHIDSGKRMIALARQAGLDITS